MCKLEHHQGFLSALLRVCVLPFVYFFLVTPSVAEPISSATTNPQVSQNPIISTNDGLVSVKATEAPLKDVIERIGQALGIAVEAQVGGQETVTIEFHDLPLDQAIKRLSGNYAYMTDSDGSKLVKLFVFPKGEAVPAVRGVAEAGEIEAARPESSPEPFKFEFDPAAATQDSGRSK